MATATLLASGASGWEVPSGIANIVSSSITPGANCALALVLYGIREGGFAGDGIFEQTGGTTTQHTVVSSGSGPTWTHRTHGSPANTYDATSCVWTATIGGTDPGSFTVTMDWPDTRTAGQVAFGIYRVTGHDTTTPFAGWVSNTRVIGNGNGAQSITLGAAPAVADIVVAISGADTGSASDAVFDNTARTWTRDATGGASGKQIAYAIGQSTGSTSTTVAWSDVNEDTADNFTSAQAAVIVKAGAAAGGKAGPFGIRRLQPPLLRR